MVVTHRWTGREAAALRQARRMSIRAFAAHLGVAVATVSNWDSRGEHAQLRTETQQLLDIELARASADVRERFAAILADRSNTTNTPRFSDASPDLSVLGTIGNSGIEGSIGVVAAFSGGEDNRLRGHLAAATEDARRYSDHEVASYFRQQLDSCKSADGDCGPAAALPAVLRILEAISDRARAVKPDVRKELLSLAADGAEFAGWLHRDLRAVSFAVYWYDRAMEWAQEANDTAMQGYVLIKKSQLAYDARDAHRVMTLAEAAVEGPWRLTGRVQSEAVLQVALGMAMTGAPTTQVHRAMDDAHELLEATLSVDQSESDGGASFTADTLVLRKAACYTEAGEPAKAAALFSDIIANGSLSRRDAGFFRARQAAALALSGEPDEASRVGLEALQLASATNSERTRQVIRDVLRVLQPWDGRPGPRQLRESLSPIP